MTTSYYIRGVVSNNTRNIICAEKNKTFYVLSLINGELVFDPRNPITNTNLVTFNFETSDDNNTILSIDLLDGQGNTLPSSNFLIAPKDNSSITPYWIAQPSSQSQSFSLLQLTNYNANGIIYGGTYQFLPSSDDRSVVSFYSLVPEKTVDYVGIGIQMNSSGSPIVELIEDIRVIPIDTYKRVGCVQNNSVITALKYELLFLNAQTVPQLFSDSTQCAAGIWYDVCTGNETCGNCYGICPTSSSSVNVCQYTEDTVSTPPFDCITVSDGGGGTTPWYEEWWVWVIVGIVIIAIIIVIIMMFAKKPDEEE